MFGSLMQYYLFLSDPAELIRYPAKVKKDTADIFFAVSFIRGDINERTFLWSGPSALINYSKPALGLRPRLV
jgi:hypothetical protein